MLGVQGLCSHYLSAARSSRVEEMSHRLIITFTQQLDMKTLSHVIDTGKEIATHSFDQHEPLQSIVLALFTI